MLFCVRIILIRFKGTFLVESFVEGLTFLVMCCVVWLLSEWDYDLSRCVVWCYV